MKLVALIVFLALTFALPVISLFKYKNDKKIVSLFFGVIVYVITTVLVSLLSQLLGITSYQTIFQKFVYVLILSLMLTLSLMIVSKMVKSIFDKEHSSSLYAGYSFINLFVYNMNAYGILLVTGLFKDSDRLVNTYGLQTATELVKYYDAISLINIVLLIVELVLSYLILGILFEKLISKHTSFMDYFQFIAGVFVLYAIQFFLSLNSVLAFICYGIELFVLLKDAIFLKRNK